MRGSPPAIDGQVTLSNWLDPPFNRWAFSHVRELVPTQRISRGSAPVAPMPAAPREVKSLELRRFDEKIGTVGDVFADTYTDAVIVVHAGSVVFEDYAGETRADTPHLLMSMSKSLVGCVVGCLVERGLVDPGAPVTEYVPELAVCGYAGATIRNLLDMRSGVRFSEDIDNPESEVMALLRAIGWAPSEPGIEPGTLYGYLCTLTAERPHGGTFTYRDSDANVLGWVCERAASERMATLLSDFVWKRIGAEHDAEITCDAVGSVDHDGGVCATARDMTRFGMLLLAEGKFGDEQVLPAGWLRDSWSVEDDVLQACAQSESSRLLLGGWYRNQFWFVPRRQGVVLLCRGANGQLVYVCPTTDTVAVKFSSWPITNLTEDVKADAMVYDTLGAFDTIAAMLAGIQN